MGQVIAPPSGCREAFTVQVRAIELIDRNAESGVLDRREMTTAAPSHANVNAAAVGVDCL